jgi:hypothetical protein
MKGAGAWWREEEVGVGDQGKNRCTRGVVCKL